MDDFEGELLARLPLAQAVFVALSHVLDKQSLGRLFDEHRGPCYEKELSVATVVELTRDALLLHDGSGRQSFERAGEANEIPLSRTLVERLRPQFQRPVLWMSDRQYCDLGMPALFAQGQDHFLIRYSKNVGFHVDSGRNPQESRDAKGRRVVEEWGWIGAARDKRRRYVRRITVFVPGGKPVAVITDLLDEKSIPATELHDLYFMRWNIERVFQQVTEVFSLKKLIGTTPKATVFQASFCFVLYNLIQVIKGYAAEAADRKIEEISGEKIFVDVTRELTAWSVAGNMESLSTLMVPRTAAQVRIRLQQLLTRAWTSRWVKAKLQPGRGKHYPDIKVPGKCISIERALREYAEQEPKRC